MSDIGNRLSFYIQKLTRDESGNPSSTKLMSWGSWITVILSYIYHFVHTGVVDVQLALGLLGIGAASRGVSQFNNYKHQSGQPQRSIFNIADNGQPR